ncbi:MAG: hypothetical protein JRC89_05390, partial [Deltaproteobacteria bacterium]|nr:hypothetical protein [Deltaproteobacteria bacterium]
MGWGYAERVRKQLKRIGTDGREVANKELAVALDLVSYAEKRGMYRVLADLRKQNEVRRVRPGVHVYLGKAGDDELRQKLWRVFRRLRTVTVDDLVELTGASEGYAKEFVRMLVRREIARRIDGPKRKDKSKYQMVNDPVKMPEDEEKARRLRKLRRQKKREALAALQAA